MRQPTELSSHLGEGLFYRVYTRDDIAILSLLFLQIRMVLLYFFPQWLGFLGSFSSVFLLLLHSALLSFLLHVFSDQPLNLSTALHIHYASFLLLKIFSSEQAMCLHLIHCFPDSLACSVTNVAKEEYNHPPPITNNKVSAQHLSPVSKDSITACQDEHLHPRRTLQMLFPGTSHLSSTLSPIYFLKWPSYLAW